MKWVMRAFATSLVLVAVTAGAQEKTSGTVTMESKSVAVGVGVTWGDGKLMYEGKTYPFTVKGLSVVDVGVSKVSATGNVFNLKKVADFAGTYTAAEASAAVGAGKGVSAMKNQKGVVMHVIGTGTGIQFTLAPKGVEIKMK